MVPVPGFLMIFWLRLGKVIFSILVPTWLQLGSQLGLKIDQKSSSEPSKPHPNLHLVFDCFLDRFLIDFWSIFDPQINKKSIKNRSKSQPNRPTTKIAKSMKNVETVYSFCYFGLVMLWWKINKNGAEIPSKTTVKSTPQLASILNPTWLHFGTVLGAKLEPSWHQIASKVDPKNETKNDQLLDHPKIDFWWILAPTWLPRGGWKCLGFLYIFALGALVGPSWTQDRLRPLQEASWDLSLIHIWRCRRIERCRSRWSPYH